MSVMPELQCQLILVAISALATAVLFVFSE
jgi:hypothetical protein